MKIRQTFDNVVEYFSGAITRIFSPRDDAYPETGVQPFEGKIRKRSNHVK